MSDISQPQTHAQPRPALSSAPHVGNADRRRFRVNGYRLAPYLFCLPFGALFTIFFLIPIGYAFYQSLFQTQRSGLGFAPPVEVWVGLKNYVTVLHDGAFFAGIGRVLLYGIITIPLLVGFALLLALLLDSVVVRFRRFYRLAFFLPYAVPSVIAALLWGFLYDPELSPIVKLLQTIHISPPDFLGAQSILWSMSNIAIWQWTGYDMLIFFAALQAIPSELYESARIDGCNELRLARYIKIPLVSPALVLTLLFSLIGTLQLFNEPVILSYISHNITTNYTPNLYAYNTAFSGGNYDYAAALAVVLALVTFALSFGFLRLTRNQSGVSA